MDISSLISRLGGADILSAKLRLNGHPVTKHAIYKWSKRGLPDSYTTRIILMQIVAANLAGDTKDQALDLIRAPKP